MNMLCRITDEYISNPWEGEDDSTPERKLENVSVTDLMGNDHSVWLSKNKDFGFFMEIENEEGQIITEKCIHPYAAESLASFCRRYLSFYETLEGA